MVVPSLEYPLGVPLNAVNGISLALVVGVVYVQSTKILLFDALLKFLTFPPWTGLSRKIIQISDVLPNLGRFT